MLSGHLPCLARIIQQDHLFWKQIAQVHVDEAHFIYTTGVEHYGLPAFHPAWGQLGEFRIVLKGPVLRTTCGLKQTGLLVPVLVFENQEPVLTGQNWFL